MPQRQRKLLRSSGRTDRLALYKADTAENSKRRFGAPMSDADLIEPPRSNRSMRKPWLCTRSF